MRESRLAVGFMRKIAQMVEHSIFGLDVDRNSNLLLSWGPGVAWFESRSSAYRHLQQISYVVKRLRHRS